jgi:hypothetical protein
MQLFREPALFAPKKQVGSFSKKTLALSYPNPN